MEIGLQIAQVRVHESDEVIDVAFILHLPLIPKGAPSLLYPAYDAGRGISEEQEEQQEDGVQGYEP